jgi:hypothetical protein
MEVLLSGVLMLELRKNEQLPGDSFSPGGARKTEVRSISGIGRHGVNLTFPDSLGFWTLGFGLMLSLNLLDNEVWSLNKLVVTKCPHEYNAPA